MRRPFVLLALLAVAAGPVVDALQDTVRTIVLVPAPMPPGLDAPTPAPVTLQVPADYLGPASPASGGERQFIQFAALLPGLGPVTPGQGRCGYPVCGDEVGARVQLSSVPPPGLGPGTLKDQVEAGPTAKTPGVTVEVLTAPPGFEEAVRLFKPWPPGRSYRGFDLHFLAYRDAAGARWVGQCSMSDMAPGCSFRAFDPATHLGITYGLLPNQLPQRQAVEDGLKALVAGWIVPPAPDRPGVQAPPDAQPGH